MELLTSLLHKYGIFGLCLMILLEYACFPVSSEIILPFCGAVAKSCNISFFILIPASVLSGLFGTSLCYFIGRIGGTRVLSFLKTHFPKTQKGIDASEEKMEHYGALAVCFGRVIPLCRTYIAFIAGSVRQPFGQYLTYSALGITVWNCVLISLGYLFQSNWDQVQQYYEEYKLLLLFSAAAIFLAFRIRKRHGKHASSVPSSKNNSTEQ